jgi:PAS domain S-box-containing protein
VKSRNDPERHAGEPVSAPHAVRDQPDTPRTRTTVEHLRLSEERFRLLVESVKDYAIFMLDPQGYVTSWNRGAENMKGYKASEIVGRHFSTFYPQVDIDAGKCELELDGAVANGRFEDEGWRLRNDGTRFWANVVITPLWDTTGELLGFAKVTRDLSERRLAEETARELFREQAAREAAQRSERLLSAAVERAEEASRAKDEFLATVSHELRTPLNAIVGWVSVLQQRALEPSIARALEVIDRNARAQAQIIDDILDVARVITGKLTLSLKPMDLVSVTKDALEVVTPSASAKQIALTFTHPSEPCVLVADPERLQQAAWNLLSNAVKFTASGKIQVDIRQEMSNFRLSVSDTGSGIAPEFLPCVFERFSQADSSSTRRVGGLGLGLALVRHIVELHGGSVSAESAGLGAGATFSMMLPIRAVMPEQVAEPQAPARANTGSVGTYDNLQGVRILVVDDDRDGREIIQEVLTEAGALVETAASASAGFDALLRFRPHVLVSDIAMPDEDGYSLLRRVRSLEVAQGGGTPALALTAYTRNDDRNRALAAGFTTHIGKPVAPQFLLSAISNLAALVPR